MKVLKQGREERINDKLQKIKSGKAKRAIISDFTIASRQRDKNKSDIDGHLIKIESTIPKLKDLLILYRKHIPHISDQNKFCASYLLICKAFGTLKPIMSIAREGASHEVVELVRSGIEALDLSLLFLEEDGILLNKWLKGEIIGNAEARKKYDEIINAEKKAGEEHIPLRAVKSDVYGTYSIFTHNGYSALLESVDPYLEDYDFNKSSGFRYTFREMHLIDNLVINIILSLKEAFLKTTDPYAYEEADKLLKEIGYSNMPKIDIDELFDPYRTKA